MIVIDIPGWHKLELSYLVLDVNGTLAVDGQLVPGVPERIDALRDKLDISVITADTHGGSADVARTLRVPIIRIRPGDEVGQKRDYVELLGAGQTVAIGNGANDGGMLGCAALGIVVLGREGLAVTARQSADVVAFGIEDALDLLIYPQRLIATLRR